MSLSSEFTANEVKHQRSVAALAKRSANRIAPPAIMAASQAIPNFSQARQRE